MNTLLVYGDATLLHQTEAGTWRVQLVLAEPSGSTGAACIRTALELCEEERDVYLAVRAWAGEYAPKAYALTAIPRITQGEGGVLLTYVFFGATQEQRAFFSAYSAELPWLPAFLQGQEEARSGVYAALKTHMVPWFRANARTFPWRETKDPYHIWLSEIMLQQTRAAAVLGYYSRFLAQLPTIQALAEAPEEKVLKLWEGLGYYSRARNLQKAAKQIMADHGGEFPQEMSQIRALPGIGAYTAGAIAAICFDAPEPAIDGNVLRVLTRLTADHRVIEHPTLKQEFAERLRVAYPQTDRGAFEQSLIELGATVCPPNGAPQCDACPMGALCMARAQKIAHLLPARTPKKKRRVEEKSVLLLYCDGALAVRRRGEKGLLAGMYELPNFPGRCTPQQALDAAVLLGAEPIALRQSLERVHIFTHVEWHMRGFVIQCGVQAPALQWADADALAGEVALPSAFRIFLQP